MRGTGSTISSCGCIQHPIETCSEAAIVTAHTQTGRHAHSITWKGTPPACVSCLLSRPFELRLGAAAALSAPVLGGALPDDGPREDTGIVLPQEDIFRPDGRDIEKRAYLFRATHLQDAATSCKPTHLTSNSHMPIADMRTCMLTAAARPILQLREHSCTAHIGSWQVLQRAGTVPLGAVKAAR